MHEVANKYTPIPVLGLVFLLTFGIGCGESSAVFPSVSSLDSANVNLIFVATPDLAHDPLGDIDASTGNLNNQGLGRALRLATYLKQHVLGGKNVNGIYALEPMTHLQTVSQYPDMGAIGFIEQFALLNHTTVEGTTGNSFPIHTAYAPGDVPTDVALPEPYVPAAQGLTFQDKHSNNLDLARRIIDAKAPGFYAFAAPWETARNWLRGIAAAKGYVFDIPATYYGPNIVYVISITPVGKGSLLTFDSQLAPPQTYPTLPAPVASSACIHQPYFTHSRTGDVNGVSIPANINTNQTTYLIRHAEAHPSRTFEDGNLVGAGQWRALSLPNFLPSALRGRARPTAIYSVDPAQSFPILDFSYVRPSLTVFPYAVANRLPLHLAASFLINPDANSEAAAEAAKNFFFTDTAGTNLSDQTVLLAWEHKHFPPLLTNLINSYGGTVPPPTFNWPDDDYDTIWTVKLDRLGNLTIDNALCEGIDSTQLPTEAPLF